MEKQKPRSYSKSFKMKVVQEVLEGKYTKEEARRVYGIKGNCAVLYWMRKFSGDNNYRQSDQYIEDLISMGNKLQNKQLAARIKELEEELEREKQRADLWQKIVEVAEEKLGLNITKKFGAKQYSELKNKENRG
jgi:transposase-like protein